MADRVRVIRLLVYEGEREWVERTLSRSIHGTMTTPHGTIKTGIIGDFPDVLDKEESSEPSDDVATRGTEQGYMPNLDEPAAPPEDKHYHTLPKWEWQMFVENMPVCPLKNRVIDRIPLAVADNTELTIMLNGRQSQYLTEWTYNHRDEVAAEIERRSLAGMKPR